MNKMDVASNGTSGGPAGPESGFLVINFSALLGVAGVRLVGLGRL